MGYFTVRNEETAETERGPLSPPPPLPPSPLPLQQDTSMVWLTAPTPSVLSEWVQARERLPSTEPPLVSEAVLERARRVMLAEGTEGGGSGEERKLKIKS